MANPTKQPYMSFENAPLCKFCPETLLQVKSSQISTSTVKSEIMKKVGQTNKKYLYYLLSPPASPNTHTGTTAQQNMPKNLQYLHPTRIQMISKCKQLDPLPSSHILHSEAPTHS